MTAEPSWRQELCWPAVLAYRGLIARGVETALKCEFNFQDSPRFAYGAVRDTTTASLVFDSISKRYGDLLALDEMSFGIGAGEIFGFVGSNGAGKNTAMRIASACWSPTVARCVSTGSRSTSRRVGASGTCPRNEACIPR